MRALLRQLEEGRGVKPVVTWDGIEKSMVDDPDRVEEIAELIADANGWRIGDAKVEETGGGVVAMRVPFTIAYEGEREEWSRRGGRWTSKLYRGREGSADGHVTLTIEREAPDRMEFSIAWSIDDEGGAEYSGASSGRDAVKISFKDYAVREEGDWYSTFTDLAKKMIRAENVPGEISAPFDSNEPDWDMMPGGHHYDE